MIKGLLSMFSIGAVCFSTSLPFVASTKDVANFDLICLNSFTGGENQFVPTTINPYGFIDYASTIDGLCAPNYNYFYPINTVKTKSLKIHLSLTEEIETHWALIDGQNSFEQIFLNEEVTSYFATAAGKTSNDKMNANDLTAIKTYLANSKTNICDLSGLYLNDPHKDETIKALANPLLSAMFADITTLDLSNNDLWYIPMFGFEYKESTLVNYKLFQKLEYLNLSNNKISHLPIYVHPKTSLSGKDFDLTINLKNTIKEIQLDNNLLVEEPNVEDIKKTNWSVDKQSSWFYSDTETLKAYIQQEANKIGITELSKADLQSQSPINKDKKIIDEINTFVIEYYQSNYLGSSTVYNEATSTSPNSFYCQIYVYANADSGSGEYVMSVQFKSFQYFNSEQNFLYLDKNSNFFKLSINGFLSNNTVLILAIFFSVVIGISVVSFTIYNIFIKKKVAAKRKKKQLEQAANGKIYV